MKVLYHTFTYLNSVVLPNCLPKWQQRLRFGVEALCLQRIESLNANARTLVRKRKTAETKIYRIVRTKYFERLFPLLLGVLKLVQPNDYINIDFSTFQDRQVLMFAKQTQQGRAIPLYFQFIRYPIQTDSQNLFIIATIKTFIALVGYDIHLVFDRGFACPAIIKFLNEIKVKFTIRIKKSKHVVLLHGTKPSAVQHLSKRSTVVKAYGCMLRIVRSKPSSAHAEAWYLVTNDFTTNTDDVITSYYHRFEIEEWFKDVKRLANLEYLRTVNDTTFTTLLWFMLLGAWLTWNIKLIRRAWQKSILNIKHKLSLVRFWWEQLALERQGIVEKALKRRLAKV